MAGVGKIIVVGFGPGDFKHITHRAVEALQESEYIFGYKTYVDLIQNLLTEQAIISTGMTEEVSRAQEAVRVAEQGHTVAVISSGDAGVYGMAGLVYEVLVEKGWTEATGVQVEVVPGISAINSCASLLGAPVMHDACTISLSDHLTPWNLIAKRIEAAAMADFVIALYNPRSGRRTRQIVEAQRILLQYRSPDTPVGLVKSAYRDTQHVIMTTLADMLQHDIGMLTTVVIGNSTTFFYDNKMITPRGYQRKYTLNADKQSLKPHQRLREEAEPWAMNQETGQAREAYKDDVNEVLRRASQMPVNIDHQAEVTATVTEKTAHTVTATTAIVAKKSALQMATAALQMVQGESNSKATIDNTPMQRVHQPIESIFELAVSPGVANKQFTPQQMRTLADVVGENGTMEYTPDHQIVLKIPTTDPESVTTRLREAQFLLSPIGDVLTLKACDFCNGEKFDAIPYAEEIQRTLGGLALPKQLNIGFNGCGMACYRAVFEDIGIVFRKGKFDLFIGGKPVGRTAHAAQPVAEGIEPDDLIPLVTSIVDEYKANAHPNERLFKYFKRVKKILHFNYQDMSSKIKVEPAPCGD